MGGTLCLSAAAKPPHPDLFDRHPIYGRASGKGTIYGANSVAADQATVKVFQALIPLLAPMEVVSLLGKWWGIEPCAPRRQPAVAQLPFTTSVGWTRRESNPRPRTLKL